MRFILTTLKLITVLALAAGWLFVDSKPLSTYKSPLGAASVIKTAINAVSEKFGEQKTEPLRGEERGRVNILFLGLPGTGNDAPDLTDSIIFIGLKPETNQLALISLPRDLLVEIPGRGFHAKINALFRMNERDPELIVKKVSEITGQPVDYYIALDIHGVERIVDALGGLNVFVAEDIRDTEFPTPDYGTETFSVQKGWRYFDGKTAQKYLRTRHSPDGDFARMRQQQAVIEAIRKKVFGLNLLYDLPSIFSFWREVNANIQTDLTPDNIRRLYNIVKNVNYDSVTQKVVDGDPKDPSSLLVSKTVTLGGKQAFVLVPKAGMFDYTEIKELTGNIFE